MLGILVLLAIGAVCIVLYTIVYYRKHAYWLNREISFYKGKRDEIQVENEVLKQKLYFTTTELTKIKEMEEK